MCTYDDHTYKYLQCVRDGRANRCAGAFNSTTHRFDIWNFGMFAMPHTYDANQTQRVTKCITHVWLVQVCPRFFGPIDVWVFYFCSHSKPLIINFVSRKPTEINEKLNWRHSFDSISFAANYREFHISAFINLESMHAWILNTNYSSKRKH